MNHLITIREEAEKSIHRLGSLLDLGAEIPKVLQRACALYEFAVNEWIKGGTLVFVRRDGTLVKFEDARLIKTLNLPPTGVYKDTVQITD